jgi:hypothetical protein
VTVLLRKPTVFELAMLFPTTFNALLAAFKPDSDAPNENVIFLFS